MSATLDLNDFLNSQDEDQNQKSFIDKDYSDFIRVWKNEKAAPQILPYAQDLVTRLQKKISSQQKQLDTGMDGTLSLQVQSLYQLECDRVQYLLNAYRRTRLAKIQKWYLHIMYSPDVKANLSTNEKSFLDGFVEIRLRHFETTVLSRMPEGERTLGSTSASVIGIGEEETRIRDGPDLSKYVIAKVVRDVGSHVFEDSDQPVELNKGSSKIIQYDWVREFVRNGSIELN